MTQEEFDAVVQKLLNDCAKYRDTISWIWGLSKSNGTSTLIADICRDALDEIESGRQYLNTIAELAKENTFLKEIMGDVIQYYKLNHSKEYVN